MAARDDSSNTGPIRSSIGRRHFLRLAAGGASALVLAACGRPGVGMAPPLVGPPPPPPVGPPPSVGPPPPIGPPPPVAPHAEAAAAAGHGAPLGKGGFGRMFPGLAPADFAEDALLKLADVMIAPAETDAQGKPKVTPESEADDEENYGMPAGYTYFGQFVDHDITFDPSSLGGASDPKNLTNFRTPAFDLDGLYGRGPDDQPFMYAPDSRTFLLGERNLTGALHDGGPIVPLTRDLPRFEGRAIIGDKRNDENVIVSQIHGLFMRFHNFLADSYPDRSFAEIQRLVRWHYQWIVVYDYLPRIIGRDQVAALLPHIARNSSMSVDPPALQFYDWRATPFMPIEFSGAAYRFGHSLVRPIYRLSAADLSSSVALAGLNGRRAVFAPNPADGLNGFQAFAAENGIDWRLFFATRDHLLAPDSLGKGRVQPGYKIDSSLIHGLGFLPEFSKPGTNNPAGAPNTNSLAYRNLKRGVMLQLPSGQAVAQQIGIAPLPDDRLLVGKANVEGLESNQSIVAIDPRFKDAAPLWFYVLAEAQDLWRQAAEAQHDEDAKDAQPTLLGPVGGRIVGEVLIGLLLADSGSFLSAEPNWKPLFGDAHAATLFDHFTMGDLIEAIPAVAAV